MLFFFGPFSMFIIIFCFSSLSCMDRRSALAATEASLWSLSYPTNLSFVDSWLHSLSLFILCFLFLFLFACPVFSCFLLEIL